MEGHIVELLYEYRQILFENLLRRRSIKYDILN